jgi:hypothetical protein
VSICRVSQAPGVYCCWARERGRGVSLSGKQHQRVLVEERKEHA